MAAQGITMEDLEAWLKVWNNGMKYTDKQIKLKRLQ